MNRYKDAGVDVEAGYDLVKRIKKRILQLLVVQKPVELLAVLVACLIWKNLATNIQF